MYGRRSDFDCKCPDSPESLKLKKQDDALHLISFFFTTDDTVGCIYEQEPGYIDTTGSIDEKKSPNVYHDR